MMKSIHSILALPLFFGFSVFAQEDTVLAKATARKLQGTWQQTEQGTIREKKRPVNSVLTLNADFTYTWKIPSERKKRRGKWKTDNYSKMSNTGAMMELLVLKGRKNKNTKIFINQLTDSTLVLRAYDYSKGAPAKDSFTDLHFRRGKQE